MAEIIWEPQPGPQTALIACPVFEVFYGGARGGGKTDGMMGDWLDHASTYKENAVGMFIRRELTQLDEAIERSKEIFSRLGAQWHEQKKSWIFPDGARLKFRYLARDADAEAYQGHSYTRLYVEEITNFPDPKPINKLKATLRSAKGVPTGFRATGNPGGPGHNWVKARYIDPAPQGFEIQTEEFINPWTKDVIKRERVFIPAKLADNALMMARDPNYVGNLYQSGSEELVRAWLEGDWNVIEGAYFDCWSSELVIHPCGLPEHWTRFRSFDWGSARPFSVGWWAVASEDFIHPDGYVIPQNALIRYREWYGSESPNVGLKMTVEDVAHGIVSRETTDPKIHYSVADPAIFAQDGGPSMAERMATATNNAVQWSRADNKRVAGHGQIGGWDQMRARMKGEERPMIYCFSTCTDSIRTIPVLQHDENKPEDLDTNGEDHAADEWRYACMSRPYTRPTPEKEKPINSIHDMTLNELWDHVQKPDDRL